MTNLQLHWYNKGEAEPLGLVYKGHTVTPSTTIFYDEYPYRVSLPGNQQYYDINLHSQVNNFCADYFTYWYRSQFTANARNLYVPTIECVEALVEMFGEHITGISGPISKEHLDKLENNKLDIEFRNKYWYNKYDIKIEWLMAYDLSEPKFQLIDDIKEFCDANYEVCQWHNKYGKNWYSNYLYVTSAEHEKVWPFLKINFDQYIERIIKVQLMEKLNVFREE